MTFITENNSIELKLTTRNVTKMLNALGTNDLKTIMFDGAGKMDAKIMAIIVQSLSGTPKSIGEIYDFIDEYKRENKCSLKKMYELIITDFNENYFFDRLMSEEEITELINNPLITTMDGVVAQAVRDVVGKIAMDTIASQTAQLA